MDSKDIYSLPEEIANLEAVLFDLNGTLLDDLDLCYSACCQIFIHHHQTPPTREEFRKGICSDYMRFYYRYGIPESQGAEDLNKIRNPWYARHAENAGLRPDALLTIHKLHQLGIKIGLVTAETDFLLSRFFRRTHTRVLFDYVKSDAKIKDDALREACVSLKVRPERCAYVDDTVGGNLAALRAGMVAIGFANDTAYNTRDMLEAAAKTIITNLYDLVSHITISRGIVGRQQGKR